MSALHDRIQSDLVAARKGQDKPGILLLGTLLADLRNREIELRRVLGDDDVVEVVRRGIKRRRESLEMYRAGGRPELAAQEEAEIARLEHFLPAAVDPAEVRAAVQAAIAAGAASVGAVMGQVMPRFKGRVEGGVINAIAREALAARP